jgi:hypothetical protein
MMKSQASPRIARSIRQTKKAANLGLSLAKTANAATKLAVSSGVVVAHRGPMMAAAMALPVSADAPELQKMGSEKAIAAFSAGTNMISGLVAAQLTWTKFAFAQAQLGTSMFAGFFRAKATPFAAGLVVAETTERAWANGVEAAMTFSQMGQVIWQRAARSFQKPVSANAERLARS